ncbi:MAG: hypothetical protein V3U57_07545 [Robiginitomaculum sp.]
MRKIRKIVQEAVFNRPRASSQARLTALGGYFSHILRVCHRSRARELSRAQGEIETSTARACAQHPHSHVRSAS